MDQQTDMTDPRRKAIHLLAKMFDRYEPRAEVRLGDDVEDIIDAIIDAAREPTSQYSRALAEERELSTTEAISAVGARFRERLERDDEGNR